MEHSLSIFKLELHPIARLYPEALAHLKRDGDLAFAANGAGAPHLYFPR
jgi:hypothetical protein